MLRIIILSMLLSGCAGKQIVSQSEPVRTHNEQCLYLFGNILAIQSQRSQLSEEFLRELEEAPENAVELREAWTAKEDILRNQVTTLYDVAYREACF